MPHESPDDQAVSATERSFTDAIMQAVGAAIIAVDHDGTVTHINPAGVQLLGVSAAEIVGMRLSTDWFLADELNSRTAEMSRSMGREVFPDISVFQLLAAHDAEPRRWTIIRKNARPIVVQMSIAVLNTNEGSPPGFVLAIIPSDDSATIQRVDENSKHSGTDQLNAEKLRAIGELAGGIAHDFNNFLLLISFCSERLLADISEDDPRRKSVSAISEAGSRAASLTRQLLAFSQRQSMQLSVVNLNDLIIRADQVIRRLIDQTISVTLRLTPDDALVNVDPDQFEHVLLNLILNAQDAMPSGGELTIETCREICVKSAPNEVGLPPRMIRMSVTDTGCGMTEEVRSRIFEPYFTTKPAGKGTGLGLAVVHGIVHQFNGRIDVRSSIGVGTVIDVLLPEVEVPTNSAAGTDRAVVKRATETILLVEDESNLRQLLKVTLESQGYSVLEARHGAAAIAVAVRRAKPIDLLLTDIELPEMSGHAVAQMLRDDYPDLPTLFISGALGSETPMEALHAYDNFLQKPFKTSELVKRVRQILDHCKSKQA